MERNEEDLKTAIEFANSMESLETKEEYETCVYMLYEAIQFGKD